MDLVIQKIAKCYFPKFESDMANTISNETLDYNLKKQNTETIETISINSIVKKYNLKKFQLILDIEGEEVNVIKIIMNG